MDELTEEERREAKRKLFAQLAALLDPDPEVEDDNESVD